MSSFFLLLLLLFCARARTRQQQVLYDRNGRVQMVSSERGANPFLGERREIECEWLHRSVMRLHLQHPAAAAAAASFRSYYII